MNLSGDVAGRVAGHVAGEHQTRCHMSTRTAKKVTADGRALVRFARLARDYREAVELREKYIREGGADVEDELKVLRLAEQLDAAILAAMESTAPTLFPDRALLPD